MDLLRQHPRPMLNQLKRGSLFEEEILAINPSPSVLDKSSEIVAAPELEKRGRDDDHPFHRQRQRRKGGISWEINTSFPDHDGYQWRKYGEKKIINNQFTRCYYRCTYHREHNCKATKYVQQQDYSDPPLYNVTYFHDHVCASGSIPNSKSNSNSQLINAQQILDFSADNSHVSCRMPQTHGIKEEKIEKSLVMSISMVKESCNGTEVCQLMGRTRCKSDGSAASDQSKIKISDKECTRLDLCSDQWFDLYEFDTIFSGLEDMEYLRELI